MSFVNYLAELVYVTVVLADKERQETNKLKHTSES